MLGKMIGVFRAGLGPHLDHVQRYCVENNLPPLTVLAVHIGEGQPGSGLTASENVDRDRERVYAHEWYRDRPLTVEMLQS